MRESGVCLVVPQRLWSLYPGTVQTELLSLEASSAKWWISLAHPRNAPAARSGPPPSCASRVADSKPLTRSHVMLGNAYGMRLESAARRTRTTNNIECSRTIPSNGSSKPLRKAVFRRRRTRNRQDRRCVPVWKGYDAPDTISGSRVSGSVRVPGFLATYERPMKAILIAVVLNAGPIYAAGLSYAYVEGSYAQLETDGDEVGGVTAGGMMREATIRGAAPLTEHLFLYGSFSNGDLNDVDGLEELALARDLDTDEIAASAITSAHGVGAGIQLQPVGDLSLYARAGYISRKIVVSFTVLDARSLAENSTDGAQIAMGARASFGRMELFAEGAYADLSDEQQGDGTALEIGIELDFSPRLAARAAYLSIGGDEGFSISARWYYRR